MAKDAASISFDARLSIFKLNDGSSLRDLSPYIANMSFDHKFASNDLTVYGASGRKPVPGLDETEFTIDFIWNQVTDVGVDTVVGAMIYAKATRAFEYYPAGITTGQTKYSGNCICTEFPLAGQVEDVIRVKARFMVNNGVTRGAAT